MPLYCQKTDNEKILENLEQAIQEGYWVQLLPPYGDNELIATDFLPKGSGVVVASGGSSGGRQYCLQPSIHLDQSAADTGDWLQQEGIVPKNCLIFNPLPIHHVSGLMPWWRSKCWGAAHISVSPEIMRDPLLLEDFLGSQGEKKGLKSIISLVPTQLKRLLTHQIGLKWLQSFSVIWVGGAALSDELEESSRENGLRLSPCYGATETAAMVTALAPQEFLSGSSGCGTPIGDVELRLASNRCLEVKTSRLAVACWNENGLEKLSGDNGWWRSGDCASLDNKSSAITQLKLHGRIDSAINSGGETVFPEQLETRLFDSCLASGIPINAILFLPIKDHEWGHRLVALVRFEEIEFNEKKSLELLEEVQTFTNSWQPYERPLRWQLCSDLAANQLGKWDRSLWLNWLRNSS